MSRDPVEVVKAFVDAINQRSLQAISDLMTDDHTFVDSVGRAISGREQMTAGWETYFRLFPDYAIEVENIVGHGEFVAAFGAASGTFNGKRGLVPENRIAMPAAWRAVVESGKVKRWQVYADWTDGMRIIAEDQAHG
jgi:ketosteroid isomerase-like protein